jgi:hypothetical protein
LAQLPWFLSPATFADIGGCSNDPLVATWLLVTFTATAGVDAALVWPPTVCSAVSEWVPCNRFSTVLQLPLVSAVAVPTRTPPSNTPTDAPFAAVPLTGTVGDELVEGAVIVGGGVVTANAADVVPA